MVRTWKSIEAIDFVVKKGIKEDGVVCLLCRADIRRLRRLLRNPSHKPRWEKITFPGIVCAQLQPCCVIWLCDTRWLLAYCVLSFPQVQVF